MKELKFRVWDVETNSMYYFESLNAIRGQFSYSLGCYYDTPEDLVCKEDLKYAEYGASQCCFKPNLLWMQYTGLKDKNGIRIFEGDIVMDRSDYDDLWETEGVYENNIVLIPFIVYWCHEEAQFRIRNDTYEIHEEMSDKQLEVIGNIYETPELVEK